MGNGKKTLLGLSLTELKEMAKELGMPAFTGGQMTQWLYAKGVRSIDEMTNLSKQNRERLEAVCEVGRMEPVDCQRSADGTVKYLFPVETQTPDSSRPRHVETVFIPDGDRATLCVSCQVGCKMNCLFCQTGKQGFEGHLTVADILNQILALPEAEQLTNIVFMGQGEPLDNLDAVLKAIEILTAEWGWAWSPRRITVSTVGVRGKLQRLLDESDCHIAVSLHAPSHELRSELMPAERAMPIAETIELLRGYDFAHQRRLSFEYIVFKGVNDTPAHARAVVNLLRGLDCRINLIRFHQIPDVPLQGADDETMLRMRDFLTQHGCFTTIRASRGEDIHAACGLLITKGSEL